MAWMGLQVYDTLINNLAKMEGNVLNGAMCKAYCPLGGAAVFQFFPFWSVDCAAVFLVYANGL